MHNCPLITVQVSESAGIVPVVSYGLLKFDETVREGASGRARRRGVVNNAAARGVWSSTCRGECEWEVAQGAIAKSVEVHVKT